VDWHQIITVLEGLAISPVFGLVGAGGLYGLLRLVVRRGHLLEPPKEGESPVWWLRSLLILTCTSVSFSHGTNDGQKSIGLMPARYALNPDVPGQLAQLSQNAATAMPLIQDFGDDLKDQALKAAASLRQAGPAIANEGAPASAADTGAARITRSQLRGDVYFELSEMKHIEESASATAASRAMAGRLRKEMGPPVQYAPIWVRVLSALCLGAGTMVGHKRVVRTLGERLGKQHMTPGQGASAEIVGSVLIGTAGFTGLPVRTSHIITSGIAGTMIAGGQGVQTGMLIRIALAWTFTLPVTTLLAGVLFYLLANANL
jgi:PiT family inorganic phosphate transporter